MLALTRPGSALQPRRQPFHRRVAGVERLGRPVQSARRECEAASVADQLRQAWHEPRLEHGTPLPVPLRRHPTRTRHKASKQSITRSAHLTRAYRQRSKRRTRVERSFRSRVSLPISGRPRIQARPASAPAPRGNSHRGRSPRGFRMSINSPPLRRPRATDMPCPSRRAVWWSARPDARDGRGRVEIPATR